MVAAVIDNEGERPVFLGLSVDRLISWRSAT